MTIEKLQKEHSLKTSLGRPFWEVRGREEGGGCPSLGEHVEKE